MAFAQRTAAAVPFAAAGGAVDAHAPGSDLWRTFHREQVRQAIGLSFSTTLISATAIVLFGTPLAYLLATQHGRWVRLIDTFVDLPTVLPPLGGRDRAIAGIRAARACSAPCLSVLGINVIFTPVAVVMAQTFVASPFFIKAATIALAGIEADLRQAAALDGASNWRIFRYITVPLAWPGLVSGAVMSWARALGEFGATILFAGNLQGVTQTMPLAIYLGFESNLENAVTLSVILLLLSFTALLLARLLLSRVSD